MKKITMAVLTLLFSLSAFAGFGGYNNTTNIGLFEWIQCSTGLTCTKQGSHMIMVAAPVVSTNMSLSGTLTVSGASTFVGGISSYTSTRYIPWPTPTLTSGTSTQASATSVYVVQVNIPANTTLTGIAVNNAGTVGTNSYIAALFNSAGTPVANTSLSGTLSSGASAWQSIPFTSQYAAVGPATYYIGIYMNGTTDRFYTIPAVGAFAGTTSIITGQTFGTVAAITPPTTFTANDGPVVFTY